MARRIDWVRVGMWALGLVAVTSIVIGFAVARTGDAAIQINDPAVERVVPKPGDLVLRQSEVGIDLASGYRGVLVIDGMEIPTVDVTPTDPGAGPKAPSLDAQFDPAVNTVFFTPRKGAPIEEFAPGEHTVTAIFWKMTETRQQARSVLWRFKVA